MFFSFHFFHVFHIHNILSFCKIRLRDVNQLRFVQLYFYIVFELWYGQGQRVHSAWTLGAFVQPVVLALLAISAAFFPSDVEPLVPAL